MGIQDYSQQLLQREFQPIRIKFITDKFIIKNDMEDVILNKVIPHVAKIWRTSLKVRYSNNIFPISSVCGEAIIPSKHRIHGIKDFDFVVYVTNQDAAFCKQRSLS